MATVNSFKVKDGSVSSIELPIQISAERVLDNYQGKTKLNDIILQLGEDIRSGDTDLRTTISTLDNKNIAWVRDFGGAVLKESYDTGGTSGKRSVVLGEKNTISGSDSLALGSNNVIDGKNALVLGFGNRVAADNSLILGKYAKHNSSILLGIGNGDAEDMRKNLFEITTAGKTYSISFTSDLFEPYSSDALLGTKDNPFPVGYINTANITKIESRPEKDRIKLATSELWCSNQMQIYAGDFDLHDTDSNYPIIIHNVGPSSSGPFTPWLYPSRDGTGQLGREGNRWSAGCFNSLFADTLSVTTVETPRGGLVYSDGIVLYGDTTGSEISPRKWLKLSVGFGEEAGAYNSRIFLYRVYARNAYMPDSEPLILFTVKSIDDGTGNYTHSVEFPN